MDGGGLAHGGALFLMGPSTLTNSTLEDNQAPNGAAGAVRITDISQLTSSNNLWVQNAAIAGGALYLGGGPNQMTDERFLNNSASTNGGAVFSASSSVVLLRCNMSENSAANGGALLLNQGGNVSHSTFLANRASLKGGAVYAVGASTFTANTFAGNVASEGGGLLLTYGVVSLTGGRMSTNRALRFGPAAACYHSVAAVEGVVGLSLDELLVATNCSFRNDSGSLLAAPTADILVVPRSSGPPARAGDGAAFQVFVRPTSGSVTCRVASEAGANQTTAGTPVAGDGYPPSVWQCSWPAVWLQQPGLVMHADLSWDNGVTFSGGAAARVFGTPVSRQWELASGINP